MKKENNRERTDCQIGVCKDMLSLRASAHTGVAIPRLDVQCCDKYPQVREIHVFWR